MSRQVEEVEEGPRHFSSSTKRKVEDLIQSPHFRQRYVWIDTDIACSPAMLNTEIAEPFKSPPPIHLLNDPSLQSTLSILRDYISTETPFNVDKLELFLSSHPN